VPRSQLLGELNQGWRVIVTSRMFERQGLSFYFTFAQKHHYEDMAATPCKTMRYGELVAKDPLMRQKLAQAYVDTDILKLNNYRALTRLLCGNPPGPKG
jgi:alkylation response protein AidB-like acyl-CoA dehydrogenase